MAGGREIDSGWSLLSHGVAEIKGLDLGNLNPIYERGLTQLDVHQEKGRWNVSDRFSALNLWFSPLTPPYTSLTPPDTSLTPP